jgi:hypothetical protein
LKALEVLVHWPSGKQSTTKVGDLKKRDGRYWIEVSP